MGTKFSRNRLIHQGTMLGFEKNKEQQRFYLLPGQGGKAARRKRRLILLWSIVFGILVSAVFAGALWLINGSIR